MKYPTIAPQPPGWYLDPSNRNQQRWFDGAGWSHHVRATTDDVRPVQPYGSTTDEGSPRRPRGKRTVAAVPVGLLLVLAGLKLALLVTHLVGEAHDNARPHTEAPPAVEQPVPPAVEDAPVVQDFPFRRAELEQEIVDRLATDKGLAVTATCPDTATVIPGMEFLCTVIADTTWGSADVVVGPAGTWTWTYLPEASSIPPR